MASVNTNSQQAFWDGFAEKYSQVELCNFQAGITTFLLANANKPGTRVLEVGCATGIGSEIVAQSILSKENSPVFVTCDFSSKMMQMVKQRFAESDYSLIPGNKVVIDAETDHVSNAERINLDEVVASQGEFRKLVYGVQASGSALVFPDAWFDCYVSNFVMQLIDSPHDQIREAYRVLKPGSVASFCIWGRRENSFVFDAANNAKRHLGLPIEPETGPSNFDLGENLDEFMGFMRTTGFNQVKRWNQAANHVFRNGAEFVNRPTLARFADETMKEATVAAYDNHSGANTPDLRTLEVIVILAWKD